MEATALQILRHQPPAPVEGSNFLPLLSGNSAGWRTDFLVEHSNADKVLVPPYCAVRNAQYLYVKYGTGEEELYNMQGDPYEMQNLASNPGYSAVRQQLHDRMLQLCSPPPPGLVP